MKKIKSWFEFNEKFMGLDEPQQPLQKKDLTPKGREEFHKWSKDDTILCFFFTKYGNEGLKKIGVTDAKDLADIIDTSVGSLMMQGANIRCLMGFTDDVLTDYSRLQEEVYNEYNTKTFEQLQLKVEEILAEKESQYDARLQLKKVKAATAKKIARQQELEAIFRQMGKDPSKMKKVEK